MADRSDDADGAASRADAVDRLERVIDTQIDAVDDFDQKAAYVTRFVGVVLGLVLTAVSLASRFGGGDPATQLPAVAAVAGGVVGLVAAVAGAIVNLSEQQSRRRAASPRRAGDRRRRVRRRRVQHAVAPGVRRRRRAESTGTAGECGSLPPDSRRPPRGDRVPRDGRPAVRARPERGVGMGHLDCRHRRDRCRRVVSPHGKVLAAGTQWFGQ